jgi:hypothetical protein
MGPWTILWHALGRLIGLGVALDKIGAKLAAGAANRATADAARRVQAIARALAEAEAEAAKAKRAAAVAEIRLDAVDLPQNPYTDATDETEHDDEAPQ